MIWFTSDWHINHKNVLNFCKNREFSSLEEMKEAYIETHNRHVTPDDTCYFLGDMFFSTSVEEAKSILSRLNGKKVLVRGNHDGDFAHCRKQGWDVILEHAKIHLSKKYVVYLSHYPRQWTWFEKLKARVLRKKIPRRQNYRLKKDKHWIIHGHTHSENKLDPKYNPEHVHVGIDAWNRPVSSEEIANIINAVGSFKTKKR